MKLFPTCVACRIAYRPCKNGVVVLELAGSRPYKLWNADMLECPKCGNAIISGFGGSPILDYELGFDEAIREAAEAENLYLEGERSTPAELTIADILAQLGAP